MVAEGRKVFYLQDLNVIIVSVATGESTINQYCLNLYHSGQMQQTTN